MSGFVDEQDEVQTKLSWKRKMENFYKKDNVYEEIFKPYGFTMAEAMMIWEMNLLKNAIFELSEQE